MSKPITGRRIKVDVLLSGGRVKLDLTAPTDAQLAGITKLLEEWLDEEKHPWQPPETPRPGPRVPPAAVPVELPAEQRDLLTKVTGGPTAPATESEPAPRIPSPATPTRDKPRQCGRVDPRTGHGCRRALHSAEIPHKWFGRGAPTHKWLDEPEPTPERPPSACGGCNSETGGALSKNKRRAPASERTA
jgi:hypothetical protein